MSSPTINLVRGRKPHFLDQFINWALSIGRALVILTEVIALCAFGYRFFLDRQIIDLHDKIVQEQNIVNFLKKNETTYRNLQDRISLAKTIMQTQDQTLKTFKDITGLFPLSFTIKNLTFTSENMRVDASVQNLADIAPVVQNIKNYPTVTSVSLDRIENRTSNATINISFTIVFKKQPTTLL